MYFLNHVLQVNPILYRGTEKDIYVQLAAESSSVLKGTRKANIFLSTKRGYIFIQTDKPIYNPGENGMNIHFLCIYLFFTFVKSLLQG